MAKSYQGFGGSVKVGGTKVAKLNDWQLEIEVDDLDDNEFGSSWHGVLPGLKSWSGSFAGSWVVDQDADGQKVLQDAILGGTEVELDLSVNGTNSYSGSAFMTTQSIEAPVDDKSTIEFEYTGNGPLTYA